MSNLFSLLQGNSDCRYERADSGFSSVRYLNTLSTDLRSGASRNITKKYGSFSTLDPSLGSSTDRIDVAHFSNSLEQIFSPHFRYDFSQYNSPAKRSRYINSESGPGLSQILSSPGSYLKHPSTFVLQPDRQKELEKTSSELLNQESVKESNCDKIEIIEKKSDSLMTANCVDCNIEQGLDILDPSHNMMCISQNEHSLNENLPITSEVSNNNSQPAVSDKLERRISRSVGSYTDDEKVESSHSNLEVGSDPLITASMHNLEVNLSDISLPSSLGDSRKEFLQQWFKNTSMHVCSEENLCPEFVGTSDSVTDSAIAVDNTLTKRTEALVQKNTTFHLVKPRH